MDMFDDRCSTHNLPFHGNRSEKEGTFQMVTGRGLYLYRYPLMVRVSTPYNFFFFFFFFFFAGYTALYISWSPQQFFSAHLFTVASVSNFSFPFFPYPAPCSLTISSWLSLLSHSYYISMEQMVCHSFPLDSLEDGLTILISSI